MKKFFSFIILYFCLILMMQCRLPDDSLWENHKPLALKSKRPSKIYDLNSHLLKMTKDPPVKDLQDWKISQKK